MSIVHSNGVSVGAWNPRSAIVVGASQLMGSDPSCAKQFGPVHPDLHVQVFPAQVPRVGPPHEAGETPMALGVQAPPPFWIGFSGAFCTNRDRQ